jgi:hypothetical protein
VCFATSPVEGPPDRIRTWRSTPSRLLGVSLVVVAGLAAPGPVVAQEDELLRLAVADAGTVLIEVGDVLETGGIRASLESGLPVRIRIVTELWRDQFFDALEGREEWQATLWHEPLDGSYRVEAEERVLGRAGTPEAATALLRTGVTSSLAPLRNGTHYYLGRIEIETLSLSDLEELRRWLQGELGPAVDGDDAVTGALGRGVRRIFVRALGLPAVRHQTRTPRFEWTR